MFSRSRWVTTAAGIFGSRSGADRVYRPTELPQYYYLSTPQLEATGCLTFLHCGFLEYWRFWVRPRSWRRRLSQLDSTRVHPAAAPLRPSTIFAPDHPPLVPKWFMFCGSCFCALGQSFPRSLPWKSLTTVSPRLCCVLAVLLASSLPPRWCFSCCFGRRSFDRRPSHDCLMTSRHH